jgi:hypothetical protein
MPFRMPVFRAAERRFKIPGSRFKKTEVRRQGGYSSFQIQDLRRLKWGNEPLPTATQGERRGVQKGFAPGVSLRGRAFFMVSLHGAPG